jgi:hypothetical protein
LYCHVLEVQDDIGHRLSLDRLHVNKWQRALFI